MKLFDKLKQYVLKDRIAESKLYEKAQLMEKILGHIGLPQGIIHNMSSLEAYSNRENVPIMKYGDKGKTIVIARLGKGLYALTYNRKGNFDGLEAKFSVKTNGQPLFM